MKTLIILLALVLFPPVLWADTATMTWDAVEDETLAGYLIWQATWNGGRSGDWVIIAQTDKDTTTYQFEITDRRNYLWFVSAKDEAGNIGMPSQVVARYDTSPPAPPQNIEITIGQ